MMNRSHSSQEQKKPKGIFLFALLVGFTTVNIDKNIISLVLDYAARDGVILREQIGQVTSAFFLSYAIVQFFIGFFVDKLGAKKILLVSLVGASVVAFGFGFSRTLWLFCFFRLLDGVFHAGYPSANSRSIADNYLPEDRAFPQSLVATTSGIGSMIAFLVGTLLISLTNWSGAMFFVGIMYLIAIIFVWKFVPASLSATQQTIHHLNYKKLLTHKKIILMIVNGFFYNFIVYGFGAWTVTYMGEQLHLQDGQRAILLAVTAVVVTIGSLFASILSKRIRGKEKRFAMIMALLASICQLPLMFTAHPVVGSLFILLTNLFGVSAFTITISWPQRLIPAEFMGRAYGLINGLIVLAGVVGPLVYGVARGLGNGSYHYVFFLNFIFYILYGISSKLLATERIGYEELSQQ